MRRFLVVLSIVVLAVPVMGQVEPPFSGGGGNGCQNCLPLNFMMTTICMPAEGGCCSTTWYGCTSGPYKCECMPIGNGQTQCECLPTCGQPCLWA